MGGIPRYRIYGLRMARFIARRTYLLTERRPVGVERLTELVIHDVVVIIDVPLDSSHNCTDPPVGESPGNRCIGVGTLDTRDHLVTDVQYQPLRCTAQHHRCCGRHIGYIASQRTVQV